MTVNVSSSIGTGLTPQQFIQGMTRNQDQFVDWYNQFQWSSADDKQFFETLLSRMPADKKAGFRCVILMADWCGDVVRNVPVVLRVMETANIPVEVLILEQNLDLMDAHFLTLGGRSIPVVLFVNSAGDVVHRWGPRPAYVQEPMVVFKQNNTDRNAPDYDDNLKATRAEIMRRYGEGTGYQALIVRELRELLSPNA